MQNFWLAAGRDAAGRRAGFDPAYVCQPEKRLNYAAPPVSGHYKYAFAAGLLIKDPVGVLGLRQLPAVAE